jgi:hypothetical protein
VSELREADCAVMLATLQEAAAETTVGQQAHLG